MGGEKQPPFSVGPQQLPGFHRFFWFIRAARPGFVTLNDPDGSHLVAPLERSEERGLFEAKSALEPVPVNAGIIGVRRALGPQNQARKCPSA
jgi:hypothetical protein